jgi:large subunit ribosomal protein L6
VSRIGKKPIDIPKGVTVTKNGNTIKVKGPKGELETRFHSKISVDVKDNEVVVTRPNDLKENKALHGLTRALLQNMVEGVVNAYTKTLDIVGVG